MLVDANLIYWVLSTGGASCYSIPPAFPQWILNQPFKADIAFIVQVKKWTPGSQEAESGFKTSAEPRGAFLTEAPYCLQPMIFFPNEMIIPIALDYFSAIKHNLHSYEKF